MVNFFRKFIKYLSNENRNFEHKKKKLDDAIVVTDPSEKETVLAGRDVDDKVVVIDRKINSIKKSLTDFQLSRIMIRY